ncbi:MAG: hypothetical protein E7369_05980 [Clostridiales bacterium]|nr:hypothetical protein [Clostridiales bacterium]
MKKINVSDFTLKVATEQDLSLTFRERLAIAEKLDALLLDAIELPALTCSKESEVIYRTIASSVKNATIKIPVGKDTDGVEFAFNCIKKAKKPCLQVIMPVSTVQMEYFHHLKSPAMLVKIEELIKSAKNFCETVEFVAQDAFRAEEGFIEQCAVAAFNAGASMMTFSDEAGEALPEDYENMVKKIKSSCDIKVYAQPSNALSMAAACAVKAISAGADGVKTSVVGEYLSLKVLSDILRAKKFSFDADCTVDSTNVKTVSDIIDGITAESSVSDEEVKFEGNIASNVSLKELSSIIKQLGYELSDTDLGKVYEEFKKVTAKKEVIDTKELEAVIASTAMQVPSTYHLINYVVNSGNIIPATANITLEKNGEKFTGVSTGDGPIDAAFHAIEQVVGHHYELDDFQVHAVTKGRNAVGSSIIRLRADGKLYPGNGVSTDIVGACIRAYINALNKIVHEEN